MIHRVESFRKRCPLFLLVVEACLSQASEPVDCTLQAGRRRPQAHFAGQDGGNMRKGCFCGPDGRGDGTVPAFGYKSLPTFTVIAGQPHGLSNPRALAFHPDRPCELWVANTGDNSITTIFNPGHINDTISERRQDAYACHFMSRVSGLAFGGGNRGSRDDSDRFPQPQRGPPYNHGARSGRGFVDASHVGNSTSHAGGTFATSQEDDNSFSRGSRSPSHRAGDNFMGPTLWSADLNKFAIENNGEFAGNAHEVPGALLHVHPWCTLYVCTCTAEHLQMAVQRARISI